MEDEPGLKVCHLDGGPAQLQIPLWECASGWSSLPHQSICWNALPNTAHQKKPFFFFFFSRWSYKRIFVSLLLTLHHLDCFVVVVFFLFFFGGGGVYEQVCLKLTGPWKILTQNQLVKQAKCTLAVYEPTVDSLKWLTGHSLCPWA